MDQRRNTFLDDLISMAFIGLFIWLAVRFWKVTLTLLLIGWVIGLVIDIRDNSDGNATQGYLWLSGLIVTAVVVVVVRRRNRARSLRLAREAKERRARLGLPDHY